MRKKAIHHAEEKSNCLRYDTVLEVRDRRNNTRKELIKSETSSSQTSMHLPISLFLFKEGEIFKKE